MTDKEDEGLGVHADDVRQSVEDQLAEVVDGTASDATYAAIAESDALRDLRHEADQARLTARDAAADYRAPEALWERVRARIESEKAVAQSERELELETATGSTDVASGEGDKPKPRREAPSRRPKFAWNKPTAFATVVALAAGVGMYLTTRTVEDPGPDSAQSSPWQGKVTQVSPAGSSDAGLSLCPVDEKCKVLASGASVPTGARLLTDQRTRAGLTLEDGTRLTLDRGSELVFDANTPRKALVVKGALVADVTPSRGTPASFAVPNGIVEVRGTKLALRVVDQHTTVDVLRGSVRLARADQASEGVMVRAGEEGQLAPGVYPYVSSAPNLGGAFVWSEVPSEPQQARGLGELKARRPGQNEDLDGAVRLKKHHVSVRISGVMARTEVDEVFENNSDEVLEGIYRFPIPADAKIERLALEVDGELMEGAFVDREKAAAIWRGALANAAPKQKPPREEIVWVPGPWKDPALLEWQRGGRFELRIFPIPKRGSRRVVLSYTQVLAPSANVRRYSYPLAHDPAGTTRIDDFALDVQVRGHDQEAGVRSAGYALEARRSGDAHNLTLKETGFSPRGDFLLEYSPQNQRAELSVWTYRTKPAATAADGGSAAQEEQRYLALSLRPKLPRATADEHRSFAIVVDASRSMFGESYRRATAVAERMLRELDPLDQVTLLACDTTCRELPSGLTTPGPQTAEAARRFLETIAPEGASDVTQAVTTAYRRVNQRDGRALKIVYIGDGTPTAGPIRPALVASAVRAELTSAFVSVTSIAVGPDSDLSTLAALAREGGGVTLPYVPGQSTAELAYAALGAAYGHALRDVRIELPAGLSEIAPRTPDTLLAGGESLVVAKMDGNGVSGDIVLRGKLGSRDFEQRYPVSLDASDAQGNAFVPRLFAALRIADLEQENVAEAKKRAIELSQRFDVASRYTSLLVLESPAMFRAFGLDNTREHQTWTGEELTEATTSGGLLELETGEGSEDDFGLLGGIGSRGAGAGAGAFGPSQDGFGLGASGKAPSAPSKPKSRAQSLDASDPLAAAPAPSAERRLERSPPELILPPRELEPSPRRRMIPMRKVWRRTGQIVTERLLPRIAEPAKIAEAEFRLRQDENRRELVKQLYNLYALSGQVRLAEELVTRWTTKEPLDAEALTARADLAARSGQRELSIRILGSVVDVRPGDVGAQERLARLHRWAERPALACRHSITVAQIRQTDAEALATAVRCARQTQSGTLAEALFSGADEATRRAAQSLLDKKAPDANTLSGDLRAEARWSGGGHDLDIALLHPDGHRVSWLGAPTRSVITASDVTSTEREGLSLRGAKPGEYVVELVRASGTGSVRGELTLSVAGSKKTIPFVLEGDRATLALASLQMRSELVPLR